MGNTKSNKQTIVCGIPQGSTLGPLLFLLYINDISNSSEKLSFRLFADDTNVFVSSSNPKELEETINTELTRVKTWCDVNKLSINHKKTNFMIIKSAQKRLHTAVTVTIPDNEGSKFYIKQKDHIKYLGVMIDEKVNWQYHISFIRSRISRNTGIFYKLRHYLTPIQQRQIYYNIVYPYITYAIVAWGSTYKSHISKLQTMQNNIARIIFFATMYGKNTQSALPLLNLLDILTINNVYELQVLKFVHNWHKQKLPLIFKKSFQYVKEIHSYNTRHASKNNLYKTHFRTNVGKQSVSCMAVNIWTKLPSEFKNVNTKIFNKKVKQFLLLKQHSS